MINIAEFARNGENEISIKVRNGTVVCTLLKNACTYDFIAIGVLDVSRNRSLCGCGQSRAQNACKSKHDSEMDLHYWLKFGDIFKQFNICGYFCELNYQQETP